MKKIFMSAIALSIVLISCQKQGVTPQDAVVINQSDSIEQDEEDSPNPPVNAAKFGPDRYLMEPPTDTSPIFCWYPGNNCYPTFIVWGIHQPVLGDVVAIIENNNAAVIVQSFIENREILIVYIDAAYVDGVINSDYIVESEHGEENAEYLQFKNGEGELVVVYPLVVNE